MKGLLQHEGLRRYAGNTSWLLAEKALRMVVGLFVGVWVARYLGPEQFGLLNYAQSYVFLFSALASLGLDEIVVREIVKDKTPTGTLLGTTLFLKTISFLLMLLCLLTSFFLVEITPERTILILVISLSYFFQVFHCFDFYFQAQVLSKYSVWTQSISIIITNLLKVVLIINNAPVLYFALAFALEAAISAIGLSFVFFRVSKSINKIRVNFSIANSFLRESWPLALSSLLIAIYVKVDQVMLGQMLGNQSVGQYSAALKLSEVWFSIPMILSASLFPAIVNAKQGPNKEVYYERLQKLLDLLTWGSLSFGLFVSLLAPFLISFLYGDAYQDAARILSIHVWAGVFVSLGVVSGKWFVIENLTLFSFWRTLVGCVLNVTLNFLFIPKYGGVGASIVTLISFAASSYIMDLSSPKTRPMFYMKTYSLLPFLQRRKHRE